MAGQHTERGWAQVSQHACGKPSTVRCGHSWRASRTGAAGRVGRDRARPVHWLPWLISCHHSAEASSKLPSPESSHASGLRLLPLPSEPPISSLSILRAVSSNFASSARACSLPAWLRAIRHNLELLRAKALSGRQTGLPPPTGRAPNQFMHLILELRRRGE